MTRSNRSLDQKTRASRSLRLELSTVLSFVNGLWRSRRRALSLDTLPDHLLRDALADGETRAREEMRRKASAHPQ